MPSYRYEVLVQGKWYPNQVYFATEREASKAGSAKFQSWTMCDDFRVVEDEKPVNYRWDDKDGMIHIASSD